MIKKRKKLAVWMLILLTFLTGCTGNQKINTKDYPGFQGIPAHESYDLSEMAVSHKITDHVYDEEGKLIRTYIFNERDDNSGSWGFHEEIRYSYDGEGRLLKKECFLPYVDKEKSFYETEYQYLADGSYVETKKEDEGLPDEMYLYDKDNRTVRKTEIYSEKEENCTYTYTYNRQGRLIRVDRQMDSGDEENVIEVAYCQDANESMEIYNLGEASYLLWVDYYNEAWQRVSGGWYKGDLDKPRLTIQDAKLLCKNGYYADYRGEHLIEELENGFIKGIDGYHQSKYAFYDYDDSGTKQWSYDVSLSEKRAFATRYVYDEQGNVSREIEYEIYGDWQHIASDGSQVTFLRDEEGWLTDIIRTDPKGNVLRKFSFDENHDVIETDNGNGEFF